MRRQYIYNIKVPDLPGSESENHWGRATTCRNRKKSRKFWEEENPGRRPAPVLCFQLFQLRAEQSGLEINPVTGPESPSSHESGHTPKGQDADPQAFDTCNNLRSPPESLVVISPILHVNIFIIYSSNQAFQAQWKKPANASCRVWSCWEDPE